MSTPATPAVKPAAKPAAPKKEVLKEDAMWLQKEMINANYNDLAITVKKNGKTVNVQRTSQYPTKPDGCEPTATPTPTAPAKPIQLDPNITGQSADQYTCSKAN